MSVKIRLKKLGRKHRPFFRVCAMDTRTRRDGREIEVLGIYDPMVEDTDARAILNGERIDYWLGVGAKPSPKVGVLIKKYGSEGTHLEAQKSALEKLGSRRAASISAAVSEAEATKVVPKDESTPEESGDASGEAAADETTAASAAEEPVTEDAAAAEAETAEAETGDSDSTPVAEAAEEKGEPESEEEKTEE